MFKEDLNKYIGVKKRHEIPSPKLNDTNIISISVSDIATEVDIQRKITYGKPHEALLNFFFDYCKQSSIHGFSYVGDKKRPYWDRLIWFLLLSISLYGSYALIYNIWIKWQTSPVIVSFDEKSTPIWQIPFPAVTICPETKAQKDILNFTQLYSTLRDQVKKTGYFNRSKDMDITDYHNLRAILQICEAYLMENFDLSDSYDPVSIIDLLENIAPVFNSSFPFCKWRNDVTTCEQHFVKTITEDGICYTFNSLDTSELYRNFTVQYNTTAEPRGHRYSNDQWTLQDGYKMQLTNITYPQRVLAAGARAGLFIALQGFDYNLDYICRGPIQGFKVLLHSPDDVPQVSKHYLRVPFDQEVIISVKPNMITTSEELTNYEPSKRQCFFDYERYLRFFKVYTQSNCNLECLTNYTLNKCGCVKFSMPRTPDMPVCDISDINCYDDAEDSLLRSEFEEGLKGSAFNVRGWTKCNCLPACTSLSYNAEISQAFFDLFNLSKAYNASYLEENPGVKMCRLSIFFKEHQFITSKRSELYGLTDFIANCGGLLGLFMGMSVISVFELLYFLTVRLLTYIQRRRVKRQNVILLRVNTLIK